MYPPTTCQFCNRSLHIERLCPLCDFVQIFGHKSRGRAEGVSCVYRCNLCHLIIPHLARLTPYDANVDTGVSSTTE